MDQIEKFRKSLKDLIEYAKTKDNRLTVEDVQLYFKGWPLTPGQWDLVHGYLELNKVEVKKTHAAKSFCDIYTSNEDIEDEDLPCKEHETDYGKQNVALYKEELQQLDQLVALEVPALIKRHLLKDQESTSKLIEYHLPLVVAIADKFKHQDIDQGDLIQEGNMALISAVNAYHEGEFETYVRTAIDEALHSFVRQQTGFSHVDQYVANQVNLLMDISAELAEELGREANLSELAERMKLPQETIEALMRFSLEAVSVSEAHGGDDRELNEENHHHTHGSYEHNHDGCNHDHHHDCCDHDHDQ